MSGLAFVGARLGMLRRIDETTDQGRLDFAETVVERAAYYEERLKNHDAERLGGPGRSFIDLSSDYSNLRIALVRDLESVRSLH